MDAGSDVVRGGDRGGHLGGARALIAHAQEAGGEGI